MSGLKLAALYSIKPYQLGFCGSQEEKNKGILLKYLRGPPAGEAGSKVSEKKMREILESFEGAYPYYKLIAKSNNIKDPLDERAVRAYWVGNRLLDKVKGSKPHHSFHVLIVGSVTNRIVLKGKLLDLCRICWGKVKKTRDKLLVEYQPLVGRKKLTLGKSIEKEIDWDKELVPDIKIGNWVSFHWNQVVEVLKDEDRRNLEKYTNLTLNSL